MKLLWDILMYSLLDFSISCIDHTLGKHILWLSLSENLKVKNEKLHMAPSQSTILKGL